MLDFYLHLDQNLTFLHTEFGPGTYLILFLIILLETGCILTVFLPGDSLLFVAGAGAASGLFSLPWLVLAFFFAAIAGDCLNYWLGHHVGLNVFRERFPEIVPKTSIDRTTRYFVRFGRKTIFIGRFIPVVRTFTPFLAGIGTMDYRVFMFYKCSLGSLLVGRSHWRRLPPWSCPLATRAYWPHHPGHHCLHLGNNHRDRAPVSARSYAVEK